MIGEKKSEIFNLIPQEYYPKTILLDDYSPKELIETEMEIGFPLIAKPDIGERGNGVEVIGSEEELKNYGAKMQVPFIIQEFIDYPIELGVFYVRKPSEKVGRITSIVQKKFLTVTGDGQSTFKDLLKSEKRAMLQVDFDHERLAHLLEIVPSNGEEVVVEQIGNHCRGTMFLDVTHEADERLNRAFDKLAKQIDGFYYGRFDLKCKSFEDLKELNNFSIVELNGCGAEPAHIYQPGFSLLKAYKVVFNHFKLMAEVSRENRKLGITYVSTRAGVKKLLDIRAYNKRLKAV
ncbi:MAG: ATP-grasp domain-containing protein [Cytophagales bacterium]|nr:ATP-grasp domain-containing protein [Cytophagales bacterium]